MKSGLTYALAAYVSWGLLSLYWKLFEGMSAWEILAQRVMWSTLFMTALLLWRKQLTGFARNILRRDVLPLLAASSVLISANWLIFIWAVTHDHMIEASLGYYINPLVNVALGFLFLKERLQAGQWVALSLALIGVGVLLVSYGEIPWISLSLALTFGLYGLAKKRLDLNAMIGLTAETLAVFPIAVGYLIYLFATGTETMGQIPVSHSIFLVLTGAATAIPLLWFAEGARRLSLTVLGLAQYTAPTIMLLCGVVLFKEHFTIVNMISFSFIWSALLLYTWVSWRTRMHSTAQAE